MQVFYRKKDNDLILNLHAHKEYESVKSNIINQNKTFIKSYCQIDKKFKSE
jgi:dihydroorotase